MERFFNHIICGFYLWDNFYYGSKEESVVRLMIVFECLQMGTVFILLRQMFGFKEMISWGATELVLILLVLAFICI